MKVILSEDIMGFGKKAILQQYTNLITGKPDPLTIFKGSNHQLHLSTILRIAPGCKIVNFNTKEELEFKDISPW